MVPNMNIINNQNRLQNKKQKKRRKRKRAERAAAALAAWERRRLQASSNESEVQIQNGFHTAEERRLDDASEVSSSDETEGQKEDIMLDAQELNILQEAIESATEDECEHREGNSIQNMFDGDDREEKENKFTTSAVEDITKVTQKDDPIKKKRKRKKYEDAINNFKKKRRTRHSAPSCDTESQYILIHIDKLAELFNTVKCDECQEQKFRAVPSLPFSCANIKIECTLCDSIFKEVSSDPRLEIQ